MLGVPKHIDSLLIARINVFMTFLEYRQAKWQSAITMGRMKKYPTLDEMRTIAIIISWNFWQMDGLTYQTVWDSALEHKEFESAIERFENSKKALLSLDFTKPLKIPDLIKLAKEDPAWFSDEETKRHYNAACVDAFYDEICSLTPAPSTKLEYFKSRQKCILKEINNTLLCLRRHVFYERQDCVIHKWKPSGHQHLLFALNIKFKDLFSSDENPKKSKTDERQITIEDVKENIDNE